MKSDKEKSPNNRIGEQGLIRDELLLDWFPEGAKDLTGIPLETATLNFMQRGNNQKENHKN